MSPKVYILIDIVKERARQGLLCRQGKFRYTLDSPRLVHTERLAVLIEEIGEVATHCQSGMNGEVTDSLALRTELVQVAALSLAWIEALDGNEGEGESDAS